MWHEIYHKDTFTSIKPVNILIKTNHVWNSDTDLFVLFCQISNLWLLAHSTDMIMLGQVQSICSFSHHNFPPATVREFKLLR